MCWFYSFTWTCGCTCRWETEHCPDVFDGKRCPMGQMQLPTGILERDCAECETRIREEAEGRTVKVREAKRGEENEEGA